jgi:hypothetical protein
MAYGRWGQFLPRHLTERAAALPHKATAPTVREKSSCCTEDAGPIGVSPAWDDA